MGIDQPRHRLVAHLESRADPATVDRLVETLASDDEEPLDHTQLRIRLVHVNLPRLENSGTIVHHPDRGTVRLREKHD